MEEDFDADDFRVGVPCGTLALKKLKIGDGMDVVVEVKWKGCQAADGTDAFINITFTVGELVEESRFERQELGQAVDEARIDTLEKTGVDYFTVHPMVDAEAVKRKTVCGGRCYTWVF